jgi:hypothetical protein
MTTYIERTNTEDTGGGCMVDFVILKDGRCIGINDECICVYPSYELFYECGSSDIPMLRFDPPLGQKKKFKVMASYVSYATVEVEAKDEEQAERIAEITHKNKFELASDNFFDWNITEVKEIEA